MNSPPHHVAVIMDGNGRWAKQRGLPRIAGHREGSRAVGECVEGARAAGVKILTLYAFSAENWKRPKDEIKSLMELLDRFLKEKTSEMVEKGVRLRVIGRIEDFPKANKDRLAASLNATQHNTEFTIILALSYGGRQEIVDAARSLASDVRDQKLRVEDIDLERFASRLQTADFPDPDLVIRTSGEMRLSNFLLWQSSYSEWVVIPKLWPDFQKQDFLDAIADFQKRHRRFGGI